MGRQGKENRNDTFANDEDDTVDKYAADDDDDDTVTGDGEYDDENGMLNLFASHLTPLSSLGRFYRTRSRQLSSQSFLREW